VAVAKLQEMWEHHKEALLSSIEVVRQVATAAFFFFIPSFSALLLPSLSLWVDPAFFCFIFYSVSFAYFA
jgi:hypothetical protein